MRTITHTLGTVEYPDAFVYAFNPLPILVTLADGSEDTEVTVTIGSRSNYYETRKTYNRRATFDAGELLRIAFAEVLENDDAMPSFPHVLANTVELSVRRYGAAQGGGYTTATEYFYQYRYLRTFTIVVNIGDTQVLHTQVSALWGSAGERPRVGIDVDKVWCGGNEAVLFVMNADSVATIPGRSGDVKHEILGPAGVNHYIGIVLLGNVMGLGTSTMPTKEITVSNTPYFSYTNGAFAPRTQKLTYHSQQQSDTRNQTAHFLRFLTPEGLLWTTLLKPISTSLISAEESKAYSATPAATPALGAYDKALTERKSVNYGLTRRYKYSSGNLPNAEVRRIREAIASPYAQLLDTSVVGTWVRAYPVPATIEVATGKELTGVTMEFDLPELNSQSL